MQCANYNQKIELPLKLKTAIKKYDYVLSLVLLCKLLFILVLVTILITNGIIPLQARVGILNKTLYYCQNINSNFHKGISFKVNKSC